MHADALSFKGDICSCKSLRVFRVHVRFRSYQGLNNLQMAFEACKVQRNGSISIERNHSWGGNKHGMICGNVKPQIITCPSHSRQTSQPQGLGRQQGGLRRSHRAKVSFPVY